MGDVEEDADQAVVESEVERRNALENINRAREAGLAGDTKGARDEMEAAWRALEAAIRICPSNHRARILLVSCAINRDDFERAREEAVRIYGAMSQAQLADMGDPMLHLSIAHAAKMLGDKQEAIRYAMEADELYRDDPQPAMILGELMGACGRNDDAMRYCRRALELDEAPTCKSRLSQVNVYLTLCCLGACLARINHFEEAESFLQRAVKVDGENSLALEHLVDVYYFSGQPDAALATAREIVERDPHNGDMTRAIEAIKLKPSPAASDRLRWEQDGERGARRDAHPGLSDIISESRGDSGDLVLPPAGGDPAGAREPLSSPRESAHRDDVRSAVSAVSSRRNARVKPKGAAKTNSDWMACCCFDR